MQAKIRNKSKIQQVRASPRLVGTTKNIIITSNGNVYDFSNEVFLGNNDNNNNYNDDDDNLKFL